MLGKHGRFSWARSGRMCRQNTKALNDSLFYSPLPFECGYNLQYEKMSFLRLLLYMAKERLYSCLSSIKAGGFLWLIAEEEVREVGRVIDWLC